MSRQSGSRAPRARRARPRCRWAADSSDPASVRYHDEEWGRPVHDDRRLFEMLTLEGAQAGLSWATILHKRAGYRRAFARFDPRKVARFDARRRAALLRDPGIVRNRLKIESYGDQRAGIPRRAARVRLVRPLPVGVRRRASRSSTRRRGAASRHAPHSATGSPGISRAAASASSAPPSSTPTCRPSAWSNDHRPRLLPRPAPGDGGPPARTPAARAPVALGAGAS